MPDSVTDEDLIRHLMEHGLSSGRAEDVIRTFGRIRRLGNWYEDHTYDSVSEHETRTFLIAPLLLALGWPERARFAVLGLVYMMIGLANRDKWPKKKN